MKCPIDGVDLVMSERQGVEIDYCPTCRGIWLDRGELDKILDRAASPVAAVPGPEAVTPYVPPTTPSSVQDIPPQGPAYGSPGYPSPATANPGYPAPGQDPGGYRDGPRDERYRDERYRDERYRDDDRRHRSDYDPRKDPRSPYYRKKKRESWLSDILDFD